MLKKILLVMAACALFTINAFAAQPGDIKGHWAESKIQAAIAMKIFDGQPHLLKNFEPDQAMTRAEFCAVLNQANMFTAEEDVSFKDVNASDWFSADIRRAVKAGYLVGDGSGYVKPNDKLTRAEAAVMLYRIEGFQPSDGASKKFKDYKSIPAWAVEAVDACVAEGVINGDDKANFRPGDGLTRAEIVALLFNVIGL